MNDLDRLALLSVAIAMACSDLDDFPENPPAAFSSRLETLSVPRDESDPNRGSVELDYRVYQDVAVRDGERRAPRGILLFHFGGPGTQNAITLQTFISLVNNATFESLIDNYVVVGLDEIGVSSASRLECGQDYTPGGADELRDDARDYAESCANSPWLEEVDTSRLARDVERLRLALGYDSMSFFAISYGAQVALTYAALYPERVGQVVLDSPLDPSPALVERYLAQGVGFEAALDRFLVWCDDNESCTFGDGDAVGEFDRWLEELPDEVPNQGDGGSEDGGNRSGNRATDEVLVRTALNLLFREETWPTLGAQLSAIRAGDAEFPSAGDTLDADAFYATTCADYEPPSAPELDGFVETLQEVAPRFGPVLQAEPFPCASWSVDRDDRLAWPDSLLRLGPMLITGHRDDPITPPGWARALRESIPESRYVEGPAASHATALLGLNACQDTAVLDYLFRGTLPEADVECSRDER